MPSARAALLSTLLVFATAAGAQPVEPLPAAAAKPEVMILGTFHFERSTADAISVTMGDVLARERQAEIEEVVERLAAFRPTKIMVEAVPAHEERLNARYRAWRAGEEELTADEKDQIGMRLARRLGHERLYPVDHQQPMDFDRIMAAAEAARQRELLAWFQTTMAEVQRQYRDRPGPRPLDPRRCASTTATGGTPATASTSSSPAWAARTIPPAPWRSAPGTNAT